LLTNLKRYYRPHSIPEALALLEKNSGSILVIAGGTKLVKTHNTIVQELVDITGLGLDYIRANDGVFRIGATTRVQTILENQQLATAYQGVLSQAAHLVHVSKMVRNVATVGGELVCTDSLSALYCALLVLQAQVRIVGGEEFALAMNIFKNKKGLGGGLLVEVLIPELRDNTFVAMEAVLQNNGVPIICASARVRLEHTTCTDVKLAISGAQTCPQRLHHLESMMQGEAFNHATIEQLSEEVAANYFPITDAHATEEFRKEISRVVIKNVLLQCLEKADESV